MLNLYFNDLGSLAIGIAFPFMAAAYNVGTMFL